MPPWAKDMKKQLEELTKQPKGGGGADPQRIPPVTPPKDDKTQDKPDDKTPPKESPKSKSFLEWLLG